MRDLFWRTKFRSRRERVGNFVYTFVIYFPVIFLAAYFEWFDSAIGLFLWIVLVGFSLHSIGWLWWLARGRQRFPLNS